ncbi:MAG TPA: sucrase/ferredoxin-like family protein [Gemmatimonadota bacterium]|nr:sucrase/ferredoxin-like family protein [Gemmatimonadota bacterium]
MKPYHRHAFACTGDRSWPARLEDAPGLLGTMARDVRDLREAQGQIPKLTATDAPSTGRGIDLLVFPEAVRYRVGDVAEWREVLAGHLCGGRPATIESESLPGRHVFVCVHMARDERCGNCGPPLLAAIEAAIAKRGLEDVTVRATSHVGGHKYAGNVIVYPEGAWYGYVRPDDAERLVGDHLAGGRILEDLYRGGMLSSLRPRDQGR